RLLPAGDRRGAESGQVCRHTYLAGTCSTLSSLNRRAALVAARRSLSAAARLALGVSDSRQCGPPLHARARHAADGDCGRESAVYTPHGQRVALREEQQAAPVTERDL